mmetsp:Transcript_112050/g.323727  ORF Transcript_112050/g.323727 Transcript_112050/m.323727 type:complete len:613 (+) Transcript_112050:142-1980(+)
MARGRRSASGTGARARQARKPPLAWASDGKSFRIDQEASGLTDSNIDDLVAALKDELEKQPAAAVSSSESVVCSIADFSHNALGDRGLRQILELLASRKVRIHVLRLFKSNISDEGAESLAKSLEMLPAPLQELHLPHNRLTARGASALLASAARAAGVPGSPPTWLRLENNRIDWDIVAKQLEKQQVQWAASENRQTGRGSPAASGAVSRKTRAAAAGEALPQVFVHRSYRHQAQALADVTTKSGAAERRYAREDMLFVRQLIQASDSSALDSSTSSVAFGEGLRCVQVPPGQQPESDVAGLSAGSGGESDAEDADASPPASGAARPAPGLEASIGTPSKGVQLSLEQYLAGDLPPPPSERFNFNAKATAFVPDASPSKASAGGGEKAKSLNASAMEFTPTRASTADSAQSLESVMGIADCGSPATTTSMSASAAEFTPQGTTNPSVSEFMPSPSSVHEAAAAAAAAAVAAAAAGRHSAGDMDVACLAHMFALQAASAATVAAAAQLPPMPFEALQRAQAAAAAAAIAAVEAPMWSSPISQPTEKALNPSAAEFRPCAADDSVSASAGSSSSTKDGKASRIQGDGSGSTSAEEDTSLEEIEEGVAAGCAQS